MPGYTDYADDYTEASIEEENAQLELSFRHDKARWMTELLPTAMRYILQNNAENAGDLITDYTEFLIPVPCLLAGITIYDDNTFVALDKSSRLIKYTYVYYYEHGNRDEPPYSEEYVEWEEVK